MRSASPRQRARGSLGRRGEEAWDVTRDGGRHPESAPRVNTLIRNPCHPLKYMEKITLNTYLRMAAGRDKNPCRAVSKRRIPVPPYDDARWLVRDDERRPFGIRR